MYDPEQEIYTLLSAIGDAYQTLPEKEASYPFMTFTVISNSPTITLDKSIAQQDIDIKIDFWGKTPTETSELLSEVEQAMRAANFMLSFCSVVPDPEKISHRTTTFKLIHS